MSSISSDIIVLDSRQKNIGSTNQAAIYNLLNVGGIGNGTYELLSYHSVNQMYNVETGVNDKIYFNEGGVPLTGTLDAGFYNIADMLIEIVDKMDNAPSAVQTYAGSSYNVNSGKYTFVPNGGVIGFDFNGVLIAPAHRLLGFDAVLIGTAPTITSTVPLDQRLHSNIFITIVEEGNKHVTLLDGMEHSLMVPLNSEFNDAIHHRKQEHYQQTMIFPTNISSINVTQTTQDGIALVNAPDYEMTVRKLF